MTDRAISPLRQRMIEDMTIRKFAPKTQHDYVQRVKHFAVFLGTIRISVCERAIERYAAMALMKRSPKMTAN